MQLDPSRTLDSAPSTTFRLTAALLTSQMWRHLGYTSRPW